MAVKEKVNYLPVVFVANGNTCVTYATLLLQLAGVKYTRIAFPPCNTLIFHKRRFPYSLPAIFQSIGGFLSVEI